MSISDKVQQDNRLTWLKVFLNFVIFDNFLCKVHYSRKPAPTRPHHDDHHHNHHELVTSEADPNLSYDHHYDHHHDNESYDYEEAPLQQYFQSRSLKAVMDTAETMLSLYRHFRSDKNDVTPEEKQTQYKVTKPRDTKPLKTPEYVVTKNRRNL